MLKFGPWAVLSSAGLCFSWCSKRTLARLVCAVVKKTPGGFWGLGPGPPKRALVLEKGPNGFGVEGAALQRRSGGEKGALVVLKLRARPPRGALVVNKGP